MAWIKNGKIYKIVNALSEAMLKINMKAHEERGWKQVGEVKTDGFGLACLMVYERKVLHDSDEIKEKEQVFC